MEVDMKRRLFVVGCLFVIVACLSLVSTAPAQSVNPVIGTWKQNIEKSTYTPGPPPAAGLGSVRQYAAGADGAVVAITFNIDANGLPSLGAVSAANYDGREYAQHTVATLASSLGSHIAPKIQRTISYTAENPYTVRIVQRQDGKVISLPAPEQSPETARL
jgi:hypothetical protein